MSEENIEQAAAQAAEDLNQEQSEAQEAAPKAEAKAEELQAKKAEGEKLSKTEEKQLKEYKLKINGKDKSFKLDLSNDAEMQKYLQKAMASDESFQQAAEVRKAAMQFISELKSNPRKVLTDPNIGIDLKKLAEEIMSEQLQDLEKTPEQRELEKHKKELESLKKQREDEKKDWEQKEFTRLQQEHERQLETDISAALDVGGLPKTARTVKAMAEYMMIALESGSDLSAKDIVPIVKNATLSEFKEVINSLSDDQLEDFMGKEIIGRLRKRNLAKAKQVVETANAVKSTGEGSKKKDEAKAEKKMSIRDFLGA